MADTLVNVATVDMLSAAGRKIGDLKRNLIRFPSSTPLSNARPNKNRYRVLLRRIN
jgi:hypothetical protein